MADNNNFFISLVAKLEETLSAKQLNKDIESIQKQLIKLKLDATLDPKIMDQLVRSGQQTGKRMGEGIDKGLSSNLYHIKQTIANIIKEFDSKKLSSIDLSKTFNLNRAGIDSSVTKQVHDLTKEINALSMEVLKTGSDESWENIIDKLNSLRSVLLQFGKSRDLSPFKESLDILERFQGKKIFVGDKSEVLQNTGMSVRELNNQFKNLGVTFTTVSNKAIKLDTIWDELFNISPGLDKFITFGDQIHAIIDHLKIAKEALYGDNGLQPINKNEVADVLVTYMSDLENAARKLDVLEQEQQELGQKVSEISTVSTDQVVQNENSKQHAYKQTADVQKQAMQEMKNATGDYEKAIKDVTSPSINKYFKVDASTSAQFKAEMEELVRAWTNAKGKLTDIKIDTRTSFDKEAGESIERLHQAVVTYKNELDEVIKKTIAWRQIGTTTNDNGEEVALHGFVEVAGQYSKALDTVNTKTDTFVKKQNRMAASLQNTINQITSRAFDQNSSRPITSEASVDKLKTQVAYVENAMHDLRNATATTFDDAVIKVRNEISELRILESELRKADNVSTKMKGVDVTSGLAIARNDLEKFKAEAKDFPQIIKTIQELDTAISKVGDASSLNAFNDQLRIARSELSKIKSETMAANRDEKVGINVSGLQSKIADLQRISPEIDKFKAKINGADVTIQSLYNDLSKVNTQSDFSVIQKKWNAFEKAAKAAGIAVTDIETNVKSMQAQAEKSTSFLASLKKNFSFLSYWTSAHYIFMTAIRNIKQMIGNVRELDDAMTNISYTMDVSGKQLRQISESALQMSKDLNTSASNTLSAVKLYANAKESAESILQKSKPAIMLSNVTGMTGENAAKMLQAVMNQFDMTQDDLMEIADTIEMVSQNMAYDFASGINEIATGIEQSGSVAKSAGLNLQEYVSMLGLVIEKTGQSGSVIGNAYKTIFQRITKASATEGTLEEDISAAEKSLRAVGIEVRNTADEFRDLTDIMADLGKVWDSLSSVEQSNISYNIAGVRQTNILKSLLEYWEDYESLVEKANNASGTTLQNQEIYAESLAGKMGELAVIWEKIGDDAISSNFLKGLADAGIGVSSLIEKIGLLKTTIASVGIAAFVQNFACP